MIGIAVLLVIAITIGATLLLTRDSSGPGGNTSTAAPSTVGDIASANDVSPVSIITFEPTCPAWITVHNTLSSVEQSGWSRRDQLSDSASWSPQVRSQYKAVGAAMRSAADQTVGLAKQTPHRVMREMYEQFIAYGRAYADSLDTYRPEDNQLSLVNISVDSSLAGVCNAISVGNIVTRASLASAASQPTDTRAVGDVNSPERFVSGPNSTCGAWVGANSSLHDSLVDWRRIDSSIPVTAWTPEQRQFQDSGARAMASYATTMERLGRQQGGAFEDFAMLGALYLSVYAAASPSYTESDGWIAEPGLRLNNTITEACKAVAG